MPGAPWGLALTAGMLAAVNPCGFAMLPAYLTLLISGDDSPRRGTAVARALAATAAMTAGFVAVFGIFGLLVTPVAGQLQRHLPTVTIGIGLVLLALGGWLVAGRSLPGLRTAGATGPEVTRTAASMAGFGAAYALASLSCTIGPFLAIVVTSFRAGSLAEGLGLFLAYAAGMAVTVAAAALSIALAGNALVARLRRAGPVISRLGGVILILAGGYVAYYGWWESRVRIGAATNDPIIAAASSLQRRLADGLDRAGIVAVTIILALLLAVALAATWRTRRRPR